MTVAHMEHGSDRPQAGASLPEILDAAWLKDLALRCGADDAGLVEPTRKALEGDADAVAALLPGGKTILSLAVHINADALRTPWMGVANREASFAAKTADDAASEISRRLMALGVRSVAVPGSFPMDTQKWPGKTWPLSHKLVAEQAGLGRMGHHRLVIHPVFGTAISLSAVLLDHQVFSYDAPLDTSACDNCKLCVAACPTGSIRAA